MSHCSADQRQPAQSGAEPDLHGGINTSITPNSAPILTRLQTGRGLNFWGSKVNLTPVYRPDRGSDQWRGFWCECAVNLTVNWSFKNAFYFINRTLREEKE